MVKKQTYGDVVREYFPDADSDQIEYFLWNHTAYPMGSETHNRELLAALKSTLDAGQKPCDCCNSPVLDGRDYCVECSDGFDAVEKRILAREAKNKDQRKCQKTYSED